MTLLDLSQCHLDEAALRRLAESPALEEGVMLRLGGYWWDLPLRQQLEERFGPRVVLE